MNGEHALAIIVIDSVAALTPKAEIDAHMGDAMWASPPTSSLAPYRRK